MGTVSQLRWHRAVLGMSKVFMDFGHTVYVYDTDENALVKKRVEKDGYSSDKYFIEEARLPTKNLKFLEELKNLVYAKGQEDRSREIGRLLGVKS